MPDTIFVSDNIDALNAGFFVDVTPESMTDWRWIVTKEIEEAYSLAAIAEMFNKAVESYNKKDRTETVQEWNEQTVWTFLEKDPELGNVFKAIFPHEY